MVRRKLFTGCFDHTNVGEERWNLEYRGANDMRIVEDYACVGKRMPGGELLKLPKQQEKTNVVLLVIDYLFR